MASSRYGRVQKRFSWVLLALLAMSIPANGLLFPLAYFDQNVFLLAVSIGLYLSWFFIAGVAVALLDLNPLKRVLFALVIPTVVFGLTFSLGIWLARQLHPSGPPLRSLSLLGLMMPLLCMSVAWMWRRRRRACRSDDILVDENAALLADLALDFVWSPSVDIDRFWVIPNRGICAIWLYVHGRSNCCDDSCFRFSVPVIGVSSGHTNTGFSLELL